MIKLSLNIPRITLFKTITVISFVFSSTVFSTDISQAQIAKFKSLSGSEQQTLAKSLGVDLPSSNNQIKTNNINAQAPAYSTPVIPRNPLVGAKEGDEVFEYSPIEYDNKKLKPFGYEVFANSPSTFSPISSISIPEGYVLGVGDVISLNVFGKESLQYDLEINHDGNVVIPNLGPYEIAGLTFLEMKRFLLSKIQERILGVDAVIGLAQLRSIRVFVLGDAYQPGPYIISSLSSISHAIFAAGGISNIGSLRKIQLKRAGRLVQDFDLYDLLISGDSSKDALLKSGDVVFIEPKGKTVNVSGEVRRPAIYEVKAGTTIDQVIDMAGGLLATAYESSIKVERYDEILRTVLSVDLSKNRNQIIKNGDVISVFKKSDMLTEFVTVSGSVTRKGEFQWKEGMKISDLVSDVNRDLLKETDLQYSLIIREVDIVRNIELHKFSLAEVLSNPKSDDNITLKPRDSILIFDKNKSREGLLKPILQQLSNQRSSTQAVSVVDIEGQVKFPGAYPLHTTAKLNDMIIAAGGITDSAYLPRIDITRSNVINAEAITENIQVSLENAMSEKKSDNIEIKSRDRIYVHQIPSWKENQYVELKGEFVFPGKYTIQRGELLSDLIKRAGGFTQFAHIEGAVFTRQKLKELEKENLDKLLNNLKIEFASKSITEDSTITYGETQQLLNDLTNLDPIGRLVIDLNKVLDETDYAVTLENGDVLEVPEFKNSINVIGQVQVTTSHVYEPALDVGSYIERSGGIKQRADYDRIYIISSNGSTTLLNSNVWFSEYNPELKPGDTIVVPLNTDYTKNLTLWSTATEIIYKSAVALAAINSL